MTYLKAVSTVVIVLLLRFVGDPVCHAAGTRPQSWVRKGDLDPTPERVSDCLPLSDQSNTGHWVRYEPMTDEFGQTALDPNKWWPRNPRWLGRQPAYFHPGNVAVSDGKLHLTMRKQEVPEMPKNKGYHTYTSAAVQSKTTVKYGYFEIKARPMRSHGSSSFWFYHNTPERWTEIDVFEIGGGVPGFERKYNMNVHVFRTPTEKKHWSMHGAWIAPADLAADFHVYGLQWGKDKIKWYFDGVLVRWVENTHWHQALTLNFDSETMPEWFGLPSDSDLPSTYGIEYVRAWKGRDPPVLAALLDRVAERMESVFGENRGLIEHTMKVHGYATEIQRDEGGDPFIVRAASLLHDIGIPKAKEIHGSSAGKYQEMEGPPIAREILAHLSVDAGAIDRICRIIANHHSAAEADTVATVEFKAVWDADWMVNFPRRYRNESDDDRRRLVEETFMTPRGKRMACDLFLK